jgi:uncharacterized membrane protein YdfJ with MMPL/SSD domain
VLFTMATSLTLLPALRAFLGHRVLSQRQRRALVAAAPLTGTGLLWRWSRSSPAARWCQPWPHWRMPASTASHHPR